MRTTMTQLRVERILKTASENLLNAEASILSLIDATSKAATDSSRDGLPMVFQNARKEYSILRQRWMQAVLRKEWLSSRRYTGTIYDKVEIYQLIQAHTFKTLCEFDNFFYGRREITHSLDGLFEDFHSFVYGLAFNDGSKEKFTKLTSSYREHLYIPQFVQVNLFGLQ